MKKLLYLMGIDWYWIKQRPQIIALELQKKYQVTVVYLSEVFSKTEMRRENDEIVSTTAVPALPFRDKSKLVSQIEKLLVCRAIKNIHEYDIVWFSYPTLFKYIDPSYKGKVVYDCMDDHKELCGDPRVGREIASIETKLIRRADVIFATSQVLKKQQEQLGGIGKTYLSRNGFLMEHIYQLDKAEKKPFYKIGYFGTISSWMDGTLLAKSLEKNKQISYHLIGPLHQTELPSDSRIVLEGVIEHSSLYRAVEKYDCLIMPFQVNDVILAVDPVKLYEYISMGKCIISVWYEEIDRFSPFVYFYRDEKEYMCLLEELCAAGFPPKYTEKQQKEFLENNSWEVRCTHIIEKL